MPVLVTGSNGETIFASRNCHAHSTGSAGCIQLALLNNMPDSALEETESQFFGLIESAAENISVNLKLISVATVPRSDRGLQRVRDCYHGVDQLWNNRFDAVIITGTEPRHSDLRQEPYWNDLSQVFDWAEENTHSAVLSCLAAHASVLHSDGINRNPLPDKQFGVFDFTRAGDHALNRGADRIVRFPHSRWNEVRADALISCAYSILTQSSTAGVDSFVKKKNKSQFVHFQGHPEYGTHTLLKEFRRDVRRFLRKERDTFPTPPHGYFSAAAANRVANFREQACAHRNEEIMSAFPEADLSGSIENSWGASARNVYRNWLLYLDERKRESVSFPATDHARARFASVNNKSC